MQVATPRHYQDLLVAPMTPNLDTKSFPSGARIDQYWFNYVQNELYAYQSSGGLIGPMSYGWRLQTLRPDAQYLQRVRQIELDKENAKRIVSRLPLLIMEGQMFYYILDPALLCTVQPRSVYSKIVYTDNQGQIPLNPWNTGITTNQFYSQVHTGKWLLISQADLDLVPAEGLRTLLILDDYTEEFLLANVPTEANRFMYCRGTDTLYQSVREEKPWDGRIYFAPQYTGRYYWGPVRYQASKASAYLRALKERATAILGADRTIAAQYMQLAFDKLRAMEDKAKTTPLKPIPTRYQALNLESIEDNIKLINWPASKTGVQPFSPKIVFTIGDMYWNSKNPANIVYIYGVGEDKIFIHSERGLTIDRSNDGFSAREFSNEIKAGDWVAFLPEDYRVLKSQQILNMKLEMDNKIVFDSDAKVGDTLYQYKTDSVFTCVDRASSIQWLLSWGRASATSPYFAALRANLVAQNAPTRTIHDDMTLATMWAFGANQIIKSTSAKSMKANLPNEITDTMPEALTLVVYDAQGKEVGKLERINLLTGEAVQYVSDAEGKIVMEEIPHAIRLLGPIPTRPKTQPYSLAGHRIKTKTGEVIAAYKPQPETDAEREARWAARRPKPKYSKGDRVLVAPTERLDIIIEDASWSSYKNSWCYKVAGEYYHVLESYIKAAPLPESIVTHPEAKAIMYQSRTVKTFKHDESLSDGKGKQFFKDARFEAKPSTDLVFQITEISKHTVGYQRCSEESNTLDNEGKLHRVPRTSFERRITDGHVQFLPNERQRPYAYKERLVIPNTDVKTAPSVAPPPTACVTGQACKTDVTCGFVGACVKKPLLVDFHQSAAKAYEVFRGMDLASADEPKLPRGGFTGTGIRGDGTVFPKLTEAEYAAQKLKLDIEHALGYKRNFGKAPWYDQLGQFKQDWQEMTQGKQIPKVDTVADLLKTMKEQPAHPAIVSKKGIMGVGSEFRFVGGNTKMKDRGRVYVIASVYRQYPLNAAINDKWNVQYTTKGNKEANYHILLDEFQAKLTSGDIIDTSSSFPLGEYLMNLNALHGASFYNQQTEPMRQKLETALKASGEIVAKIDLRDKELTEANQELARLRLAVTNVLLGSRKSLNEVIDGIFPSGTPTREKFDKLWADKGAAGYKAEQERTLPLLIGRTYEHTGTRGIYEILQLGKDEADSTPVVVYQNVKSGEIWTRPVSEWTEKRFTLQPEEGAKVDTTPLNGKEIEDLTAALTAKQVGASEWGDGGKYIMGVDMADGVSLSATIMQREGDIIKIVGGDITTEPVFVFPQTTEQFYASLPVAKLDPKVDPLAWLKAHSLTAYKTPQGFMPSFEEAWMTVYLLHDMQEYNTRQFSTLQGALNAVNQPNHVKLVVPLRIFNIFQGLTGQDQPRTYQNLIVDPSTLEVYGAGSTFHMGDVQVEFVVKDITKGYIQYTTHPIETRYVGWNKSIHIMEGHLLTGRWAMCSANATESVKDK